MNWAVIEADLNVTPDKHSASLHSLFWTKSVLDAVFRALDKESFEGRKEAI